MRSTPPRTAPLRETTRSKHGNTIPTSEHQRRGRLRPAGTGTLHTRAGATGSDDPNGTQYTATATATEQRCRVGGHSSEWCPVPMSLMSFCVDSPAEGPSTDSASATRARTSVILDRNLFFTSRTGTRTWRLTCQAPQRETRRDNTTRGHVRTGHSFPTRRQSSGRRQCCHTIHDPGKNDSQSSKNRHTQTPAPTPTATSTDTPTAYKHKARN